MISKWKSLVVFVMILVVSMVSTVAYGADKNFVLKVAHIFAPTHPAQKGLELFKKLVEEKTSGVVRVDTYHSGVLGGDTEELQQVIAGTLDAAVIMGISIWTGMNPKAAVEELPFLFRDYEMAHNALDGAFGEKLASDVLEPVGIKVLSYWENGFRHFTNNVRPIIVPEDMKGIKFRSAESPIRIEMFKTLGASAVPIAFPELFTALQQGVVDGQENPLAVIESSRFYEVQKYLSLSGHIYNAGVFIVNPKTWERYPDDVKEIIQAAAHEAKDYERKLNGESDTMLVEKLKELGMQINEVDKEAFTAAVQPVWQGFMQKNGSELVDLAIAAGK